MFVLNCNFELGVLDECVAIAVTNSMCTDLPVVHMNSPILLIKVHDVHYEVHSVIISRAPYLVLTCY